MSASFIIREKAEELEARLRDDEIIITLGKNGILDLGNNREGTQRALFPDEHWDDLVDQYGDNALKKYVLDERKVLGPLRDIEKSAKEGSLAEAKFKASQAEYLTKNETCGIVFAIYYNFLDLLQYNSYMLNKDDQDISESDHVVNVWSEILTLLFRNTDLRWTWGETVCTSPDDDKMTMKAELRVIRKKGDFSSAEVINAKPRLCKVHADRTKLLVEGKMLLNRLYPHGIKKVYLLQISGLELSIISLKLAEKRLYVANTIASVKLPDSKKKLPILRKEVLPYLLAFKDVVEDLYEKEQDSEKEKAKGHGIAASTDDIVESDDDNAKEWIDPVWLSSA